jgi:hypothetical protein
MIAKLIPGPPEEYIATAKDMYNKITEDGQISPQIGMFHLSEKMYKTMPLEVGNDPFSTWPLELSKVACLIPTKIPRLSVGRKLFGHGSFLKSITVFSLHQNTHKRIVIDILESIICLKDYLGTQDFCFTRYYCRDHLSSCGNDCGYL